MKQDKCNKHLHTTFTLTCATSSNYFLFVWFDFPRCIECTAISFSSSGGILSLFATGHSTFPIFLRSTSHFFLFFCIFFQFQTLFSAILEHREPVCLGLKPVFPPYLRSDFFIPVHKWDHHPCFPPSPPVDYFTLCFPPSHLVDDPARFGLFWWHRALVPPSTLCVSTTLPLPDNSITIAITVIVWIVLFMWHPPRGVLNSSISRPEGHPWFCYVAGSIVSLSG